MSKTKKSIVPHYEMLYIISNKFAENEVEAVKEKVEKFISDKAGEVTFRHWWGKKKMTYQINGFAYGYYMLIEFDLPAEKLAALDREMRLSTEVIRHMITKRRKRTAEEIKAEEDSQKKIAAVRQAKEEKEQAVVEEKKAKAKEEKVDLVDLDEKLDKILETGDLL